MIFNSKENILGQASMPLDLYAHLGYQVNRSGWLRDEGELKTLLWLLK